MIPKLQTQLGTPNVGWVQLFKSLEEGFAQTMRWFAPRLTGVDPTPVADAILIHEAAALLLFAKDYFTLEWFHRKVGFGHWSIEAQRSPDRVRFLPRTDDNARKGVLSFDDRVHANTHQQHRRDSEVNLKSKIKAEEIYHRVPHRCVDGRIVIDDLSLLSSPEVLTAVETRNFGEIMQLPDDTNLGEFTIGQLDRYWACFVAWSICATKLYLHLIGRQPQEKCMPTQVLPYTAFIAQMSQLTELKSEIVTAITAHFTFPTTAERPDIILQPLLRGPTTISWSCFIAQVSQHRRNALKILSRDPAKRDLAASIIGSRERPLMRALGQRLEKAGWVSKILTRLGSPSDPEIDLVGYHRLHPTEVLVVEGKAVLETDELQEIVNATNQMRHGQEQVLRAITFLRGMDPKTRTGLFPFVRWSKVSDFFPIVVTPNSEPGSDFDHSIVPALSIETLRLRLRARDWRNPRNLWKACFERPWLEGKMPGGLYYRTLEICGIRYELPVYRIAQS
jgi:hypothetical protein